MSTTLRVEHLHVQPLVTALPRLYNWLGCVLYILYHTLELVPGHRFWIRSVILKCTVNMQFIETKPEAHNWKTCEGFACALAICFWTKHNSYFPIIWEKLPSLETFKWSYKVVHVAWRTSGLAGLKRDTRTRAKRETKIFFTSRFECAFMYRASAPLIRRFCRLLFMYLHLPCAVSCSLKQSYSLQILIYIHIVQLQVLFILLGISSQWNKWLFDRLSYSFS